MPLTVAVVGCFVLVACAGRTLWRPAPVPPRVRPSPPAPRRCTAR